MGNKLRLGIPKGSLQESTLALFASAGLSFYGSERSLWLASNDVEVEPVLLRAQEIPLYVAKGDLDCGLAGMDWIVETNCDRSVRMLADLCYSKRSFRPVRWVLAVSNDSTIVTVDDLKRVTHPPLRVSTELKKITENWLSERGVVAEVDFSWGATEAKAKGSVFADAIVECTETGASLRANGLRELATVFQSTTQFFANKDVYRNDEWKGNKLDGIAVLLKSCLAADTKVSVHVHASCGDVEVLKALIPSQASFSVWNGHNEDMLIEVILEKSSARDLIPVLARNGARRISVASIDMLYE
jgi:ATP phosphoribosyltransferase